MTPSRNEPRAGPPLQTPAADRAELVVVTKPDAGLRATGAQSVTAPAPATSNGVVNAGAAPV